MEKEPTLSDAIIAAGGPAKVAAACGLKSYQAVRKWEANGLPRTEWTGETSYAGIIAKLCKNNDRPQFNKTLLLKLSKEMREVA